jgi:hypothetical protein
VTKLTKQEHYALARVGLSRAVVNDGTEFSRAFWLLFRRGFVKRLLRNSPAGFTEYGITPLGRARLREACGKAAE